MTNYKEILKLVNSRKSELEKIVFDKRDSLKSAPEGELRTAKCRNTVQYFRRQKGGTSNGEYIKKDNIELAVQLAQKEYDSKILAAAEKELRFLDGLKRLYDGKSINHVDGKLVKEKMCLVNPVEKNDDEFIKEWQEQEYNHYNAFSENLKYINSKGIHMRSKSEVIISNILDEYEIPYIYEKPLKLSRNSVVVPDFTLLDMRNRQEVYLEHLGLMDNMDYIERNISKIRSYEDAGIYIGQRLLITYEAKDMQLNVNKIRKMIESYFE